MYIVYYKESVGYTSHLLTIYCIQFNGEALKKDATMSRLVRVAKTYNKG